MKNLKLLVCLALVGGVIIQSFHYSYEISFIDTLEVVDFQEIDDLDKKEKEFNEKISQSWIAWKSIEFSSINRNDADLIQLNYRNHFLDSNDNPPELG